MFTVFRSKGGRGVSEMCIKIVFCNIYIFFCLPVNKIILDKECNQFSRLMNKKKKYRKKKKKVKFTSFWPLSV